MGEVVGMAASLCKKHGTNPRGVYQNHLDELKSLMEKGVAPPPVPKNTETASKPTWLNDAGENLAKNATVTVSSLYTKANYPASNINDGRYDLSNNEGRWVSDEDTQHFVTFEWEQPVKINAMRILSGQAGGDSPKTPITDFSLQQIMPSKWVNIPGTVVTENDQCDFGCKFPEVEVIQLRLVITNTPGNLARLWEVEFYELK